MSIGERVSSERKCEILGVLILGLTLVCALSLLTDTFQFSDAPARVLDGSTKNLLGPPGAWISSVLSILVGDAAHVLYALTLIWGLMLLVWHRPVDRLLTRFLGTVCLMGAAAGLLQVNLAIGQSNPEPGGFFGAFVADRFLQPYFGLIGANVIGGTFVIIGLLLATDFLFVHIVVAVNHLLVHVIRGSLAIFSGLWIVWRGIERYSEAYRQRRESERAAFDAARKEARTEAKGRAAVLPIKAPTPVPTPSPAPAPKAQLLAKPPSKPRLVRIGADDDPSAALPDYIPEAPPEERINIVMQGMDEETPFDAIPELDTGFSGAEAQAVAYDLDTDPVVPAPPDQLDLLSGDLPDRPKPKKKPRLTRVGQHNDFMEELPPDYQYPKRYGKPSIDIFDRPEPRVLTNLDEQLRATGVLIEETLKTFGIEARVTDVTRGPTITRFEIEPAPGIKVSRFQALSDDIALALKAHRVRVEAPIPGKSRVGIEVPNVDRDQVLIRDLIERRSFTHGKGKLNLALGKDISGEVVIVDLATMPHLLVAGATGAGKTVCIKALMASLLCAHVPDELQLMLIDPKMVELSIFNDIPHLITPVVIDAKKASTSLTWLINEMEERYRLFADLRVRNIEVYNQSVENGEIAVEGADETEESHSLCVVRKLPYIVCIIDELADLMMLARAEVEDSIARLAQLARAVGIHLIIATQRPSVDVLTGVIKANFPARISFQVSSRVDSRCILDEIGAERLIGMGDMLYLPAGQSKPTRIQGAFVSDNEMGALIGHLKRQAPPQYRDEIEKFGQSKDNMDTVIEDGDPLLDEAVQVVLDTGQASISMVQRRLRVGYTRAARLIDMMELKGIVGPHTGSKAREILVSTSQKDEVA